MIGRLQGVIAEKTPPLVVLDVQGIGYEVSVPMSTFYNLPAVGMPVQLLTHMVVREDAHLLYGFLTPPERETFRLLVKISGVGPSTALAILSGLSVNELAAAVAAQEPARFIKVPGIGKKTAARLLLELEGKLGESALSNGGTLDIAFPTSTPKTDILQALIALGYNDKEAQSALKALPTDITVSDGIKQALKALSR
jgi:Holliday junction DNA helicase RuvA